MKNPVAIFSSVAAIAAAALGTTLYVSKAPDAPMTIAAPVETAKTPEVAAATETPTQPQAAVEPAPAAEQPAAATTEVAMEPAAETPAVPAPAAVEPAPAQQEQVVAVAPSLPSFDSVRVEKTGDAVIAGRAEPDSDVTVKWNGNVVGTTKANADGAFVLIPAKALKTGIGAMTIEMSKSGKITISEGSVFVVVKKDAPATIAKVDPVAPTQVVQSGTPVETPSDLQLTAVDYDTTGNIVFSGKAAPGTIVRFYVDNAATGEGLADAAGAWSFAGTSTVAPGTHVLRADAVDAAGTVISRIELPFLREDPATVAAAQVAVVAAPAEVPAVTRSAVAEQPDATTAEQPAVPAAEVAATPAPEVAAAPAAEPAPQATPDVQVATTPEAPAAVPAPQSAADVQVATAPETPAAPSVEEGPKKLVIQPGNNLWKLSREVYGKGRMYTIIYEANRDLVKNPNRIYPGQILTAPKQP